MCHDTTENRKQWEKKRKNKSLVSLKERMSERVGKRSKDREKKTKAREKESERKREKEREREEKEEEFHGENQRVYFLDFWLSRRETKANEEVIQVTNNKKKR